MLMSCFVHGFVKWSPFSRAINRLVSLKQNSHTSAAWKMYCKCCHAIGSCLRRDKVFDNVMGTMKTW